MTAREMQQEFDTIVQLVYPAARIIDKPDSYTIFKFLNIAQETLIKSWYSGFTPEGRGVEQNQRRVEDLRILIKDTDIEVHTNIDSRINSYLATLPLDYFITLSEEASIIVTLSEDAYIIKRQGITESTSDRLRGQLDNPYSEHRLHYEEAKPLRLFKGEIVELIADNNYQIHEYHLRYLRHPLQIELGGENDCELPVHTHREIVNLATTMYLQTKSSSSNTANDQSENNR